MKKDRSWKQRLISALLVLVMMITSLLGTTFAWFTDEVTSAGNKIETGSLKADLLHKVDKNWISLKDNPEHKVFDYDKWEPGYTTVEALKVANLGSLALQYQLSIEVADGTAATGKNGEYLADVIDVYVMYGESTQASLDEITANNAWVHKGTLAEVMKNPASFMCGQLLPSGEVLNGTVTANAAVGSQMLSIALHMQECAGNEYQELSIGDIYVNLVATQWGNEDDSFGNDYDNGATFPSFNGDYVASAPVEVNGDNTVKNEVTISSKEQEVSATVPAGALLQSGVNTVTLTVSSLKDSDSNIEVSENQVLNAVDVHVSGIAAGNTAPILVTVKELLAKGLNMGNYKLYHVENGSTVAMTYVANPAALDAHNEFAYDPATGDVVMALCSFSEIALLIADTANPWNGTIADGFASGAGTADDPYIIANADQLAYFGAVVGGMRGNENGKTFDGEYVKLIADINLGDKESENNPNILFYPIGYYNSERTYEKTRTAITSGLRNFSGIFDGNGNTVSNFYHNTWEMKGDNEYYAASEQCYRDGMGLFGKIYKGTVKNLTVKNFSSDGEYTTTGVIAAYADGATFENVAIFDCNPRVYNIGNGGIVGCVGWYAQEADLQSTFTNITVDNSNKISALWGSYDVACGGIVGQYYPTSGQTSADNPANAGVHFDNCHIAAQMDVYNDVCANYQYYAYRYTGMLIGSVRENETIDGHVYPKLDGIEASGCTVHFGDWNDYYYCELVANSLASYTHDHQFSRLEQVASVDAVNMTVTSLKGVTTAIPTSGRVNYVVVNVKDNDKFVHATENATCYHFVDGKVHNHDDYNGDGVDDYETVNGESIRVENNRHIYLEFNNLVTGYGWGVTTKGVGDMDGVTILDREVGDSVEKFEGKFKGNFLYRVGNGNAVSLGSLFKAKDSLPDALKNITSSSVWVTVEAHDENMVVSGVYTRSTTASWTDAKIQFSGTGIVKVTIQDYNFCIPTTIELEVVDAVNATSAASAIKNNVVLLNDVGLHTIEVSNGYTLYGNGFKMEAKSDVMYDAMNAGFVVLRNGTLDNVQIICPNFSYAILYTKNITEAGNQHAASSDSSSDAYGNVRSAVMSDGNSKIVNSYVHGGRAAIFLRSGNLLVDNSTISGGAAANIHAVSAQSLTLRNATLIQKPFEATVHDTTKTLMGFSGVFECDENGVSTPLILEGSLLQNAWINESYKKYVPSDAASIVENALGKTDYLHDLDGDGKQESLNLGFTYIPQELGKPTSTDNIKDNRTNKNEIPYGAVDVGTTFASANVFSYKNTNGTSDDFCGEYEFTPEVQGVTAPTVNFTDGNADRVFETKFDSSDLRWEYSLIVNLDNGNYTFSFDKLLVQKHGANLAYTVKTDSGNVVDTSKAKPLTASGVTTYVLTVVDNDTTHTIYFILTATKTSIPEPEVVDTTGGTPLLVVKSKNSDWSCAIPALEGITIKYYTANGEVELNLATLTPTSTGKQNGTNNYWEETKDGYKLKVTCGYIHDTKQIYGMPVVVDNNGTKQMYFTISSTNGYVSTGTAARAVTLTYEFTDPNGKTLTFSKTTQFNYADYKNGTQYSYSDFVNGTLKEASDGGCVTPDTLVTLADGSKKEIQYVTYEDQLLVWDFVNGEYAVSSAIVVRNHGYGDYRVLKLNFSDGTTVNVIEEHGFFDVQLNEFVMIGESNVDNYIGHEFIKSDGEFAVVTLESYSVAEEYTAAYSILTAVHYNCVLGDMFTLTPNVIGGNYFMPFAVGEYMKFDPEKMHADIEKYGLFTYEEFADFVTEEQFYALNAPYVKVAVGKGIITMEELFQIIETLIPKAE